MNDQSAGPCPQCGAIDCKRWKMLDGQDVCDECWLDYSMDQQAMHWREARAALPRDPSLPKSSESPRIRRKTGSDQPLSTSTSSRLRGGLDDLGVKGSRAQDHYRCKVKWQETADQLLTPGYNSICAICSHIFYGARLEKCSRCGGLCSLITDHGMKLMGRNATQVVEKSRG